MAYEYVDAGTGASRPSSSRTQTKERSASKSHRDSIRPFALPSKLSVVPEGKEMVPYNPRAGETRTARGGDERTATRNSHAEDERTLTRPRGESGSSATRTSDKTGHSRALVPAAPRFTPDTHVSHVSSSRPPAPTQSKSVAFAQFQSSRGSSSRAPTGRAPGFETRLERLEEGGGSGLSRSQSTRGAGSETRLERLEKSIPVTEKGKKSENTIDKEKKLDKVQAEMEAMKLQAKDEKIREANARAQRAEQKLAAERAKDKSSRPVLVPYRYHGLYCDCWRCL